MGMGQKSLLCGSKKTLTGTGRRGAYYELPSRGPPPMQAEKPKLFFGFRGQDSDLDFPMFFSHPSEALTPDSISSLATA